MPAVTLSVVIITRNEALNIEACIASVGFADEWIVVDSGSGDATVEIARRLGASVVETADWPGFGVQKQRALERARGTWVLALDADERVTPELAAEIRRVVDGPFGASGTSGSASFGGSGHFRHFWRCGHFGTRRCAASAGARPPGPSRSSRRSRLGDVEALELLRPLDAPWRLVPGPRAASVPS